MKNRIIVIPIAIAFIMALSACAQTQKGAAKKQRNNSKAVLLQATEQTTLPGRPETPPQTDYKFVVAWKGQEAPLGFFWYHKNNWQSLGIRTVKNYTKLNVDKQNLKHKVNYEIASNSPDNVSANDTLLLFPNGMSKSPIPEEVQPVKEKTVYYKTSDGKWMTLPINEITKLPSIVMP